MFLNKVLMSIFRPKKGKITGGWRKMHNEKLQKYCLGDQIKKDVI
jgi:uncharacterized protein YbdZ (MbtH family)